MTTIALSTKVPIRNWESATGNTTVASNLPGVTLTGVAAAAYLFGQAIRSVDGGFFGAAGQQRIARSDAAFEFPPGSANRASLTEIADALHYKFGVDPIIEYSSDLGVTGYSLADLNALLRRLNTEYADRFSLSTMTYREVTPSVSPTTTVDGASADLLLADLMTDAQRQALFDLASQLKRVVSSWLDGLAGSSDRRALLFMSDALNNGLALSTTSTLAIPGQTVSLATLVQRAGAALGVDFAARLPDLFQGNAVHLDDVNVLLAAAREALPSRANDLADLPARPEGIDHAGTRYTGDTAFMVYAATAIASLKPQRASIGWGEAVFTDPFDSARRLSLNDLKTAAPSGFNPFAYLGTPAPDRLSVADLNAYLSELNRTLNLTGPAAFTPLSFVDAGGRTITAQQAYLNEVIQALGSAGSVAPLSSVWSAAYQDATGTPTVDLASYNTASLAATKLGTALPGAMATAFGINPQRQGESLGLVDGALGYSSYTDLAAMDAAMVAAGASALSAFPPQVVGTFQAPRVASIKYYDDSLGVQVQSLTPGRTYRVEVTLSAPWPDSQALRAATNSAYWQDTSGFWYAVQNDYPGGDGIQVNWNGSVATPLSQGADFWTQGVWSKLDATGTGVKAKFTVNSAVQPADLAGILSIDINSDSWFRYRIPGAIADLPLNQLKTNFDPAPTLLGWTGPLPTQLSSDGVTVLAGNPSIQSQPITAALFEYPPGSGTRVTLAQLSQRLAADYLGPGYSIGASGQMDLVKWFMGTGGTLHSTPAAAAQAYVEAAASAQPSALLAAGFGSFRDGQPFTEWSLKAAMLALWWNFNVQRQAQGNSGQPAPIGLQPVVAGPAQTAMLGAAALSADVLGQPLSSLAQVSNTLSTGQQQAFASQAARRGGTSLTIASEVAEIRRTFKDQTGASLRLANVSGLDAVAQKQLSATARALQSGMLDEGVLQRLAFGERIGWDEALFFDGQGLPTSLGTLLGGKTTTLAQRLLAVMPQLADLGLRYDDLRRIVATAASLDSSINPGAFDDPARAPLIIEGIQYRGGAAVLLRVAAALRSVPAGTYASVALEADAKVFDDPIQPGSGIKWSLNDLDLLARRSSGYTALAARSGSYDTDLDAIARQLEQVAGKVSSIALTSNAISDGALSWFAKQLTATGPMPLLTNATQARFVSGGTTKSFTDLLADAQRLFGSELAPRLEAMGVLQTGPLLSLVNVSALNQFLAWQKARDPLVTVAAITINPALSVAQTTTAAAYGTTVVPLQYAGRELKALQTALAACAPLSSDVTNATWRATQQRLGAMAIELGSAAQAALGMSGLVALRAVSTATTQPADGASAMADVQAKINAALSNINSALTSIQVQLQDLSTGLDLKAQDVASMMGVWAFASDQPSVVQSQQQQLAATDLTSAELVNAWQNPIVATDGSIRPDVSALTADATPRRVRGAQGLATLLAQSLASLSPAPAAATTIDPDAALFADPAGWASRALRTVQGGADGAPKISLRQLAARGQAALGFNLMTSFAPASGPWTVARVGGVVQLLNDALGFKAANPYSGATAAAAVGSAQSLRDTIVRADTQELVIPAALRGPVASLVNRVSELTAGALDAGGFFSASSTLFAATPGGAKTLTFNNLLAGSPALAAMLQRMGILVTGAVNARGLNRLLDIARAAMPDRVTATPLALPAGVAALDASSTLSLDQFESIRHSDIGQRSILNGFQALVDEWKQRDLNARVAASEWRPWKDRLQAVVDQAQADGQALPVSASTVSNVLALVDPPMAWTGPREWLQTLRTRIQTVIADADASIAQMQAYSTDPAFIQNAATPFINSVKNSIRVPFAKALESATSLLAALNAGTPIAAAIAAEKTRLSNTVVDWAGTVPDVAGAPVLTGNSSTPTTANPSSAGFDLLDWLHTFDMSPEWLNAAGNRDAAVGPYPSTVSIVFWVGGRYPGAQDFSDAGVGDQGASAVFTTFATAVTDAIAALNSRVISAQPAFAWTELSERLMARERVVPSITANLVPWYQVAQALQEVRAQDLPPQGGQALFEYPPGSGVRYQLSDFRRQVNSAYTQSSSLPSVNQVANAALYALIAPYTTASGSVADAIKQKIADLKANGQASGDVLSQLTQGVFTDDDANRLLNARTRPLDDTTGDGDNLRHLRAVLETNAMAHAQTRGLLQELIARLQAIEAQPGESDASKCTAISILLQGLQSRPLPHQGITMNGTVTDVLAVATRGQFRFGDAVWPNNPFYAQKPLNVASNRSALLDLLQQFLKTIPVDPPAFDIFSSLQGDVDWTRFDDAARNRLVAAIARAFPEIGGTLSRPAVASPAERALVERLAEKIAKVINLDSADVRLTPQIIRTEGELRQDLTNGADVYVDRAGAFYINGVRTRAVDVAVVSRFLLHDKLSDEYKTLMNEMSQRNNLISAARSVVESIDSASGTDAEIRLAMFRQIDPLQRQLGSDDLISELTGGKYSTRDIAATGVALSTLKPWVETLKTRAQTVKEFFQARLTEANQRKTVYTTYNGATYNFSSEITSVNSKITAYTTYIAQAEAAITCSTAMIKSLSEDTTEQFLTKLAGTDFQVNYAGASSDTLAWLRKLDIDSAKLTYDSMTKVSGNIGGIIPTTLTVDFSNPTTLGFNLLTAGTQRSWVLQILADGYEDTRFMAVNLDQWRSGTGAFGTSGAYSGSTGYSDNQFSLDTTSGTAINASARADIKGLLNTLISNKIRDGDLAQSKLQALTAQLQNNVEAISSLIKAFNETTKNMAQALR